MTRWTDPASPWMATVDIDVAGVENVCTVAVNPKIDRRPVRRRKPAPKVDPVCQCEKCQRIYARTKRPPTLGEITQREWRELMRLGKKRREAVLARRLRRAA